MYVQAGVCMLPSAPPIQWKAIYDRAIHIILYSLPTRDPTQLTFYSAIKTNSIILVSQALKYQTPNYMNLLFIVVAVVVLGDKVVVIPDEFREISRSEN